MAVDVWDDDGRPAGRREGRAGLHEAPSPRCRSASGTIPKARSTTRAYFERFDNVWCHGDFAEWTEHGGMIIHGRSDATLNPGGVRIGTAEIYNQVEQLPEIAEAICIGQDWDNDVRVVLFVRLAPGVALDAALEGKIRAQDPLRRQPAPRAGQDRRRRPTSRAPSPARSPSLPCATSSTAAPSRTRRRSPIRRRWSFPRPRGAAELSRCDAIG